MYTPSKSPLRDGGALAITLAFLSSAAEAKLVRVELEKRADVLAGHVFGKSGPYEYIRGRAYFAVDPKDPLHGVIVDLQTAAVNSSGHVEFSADLFILKPRDPALGTVRCCMRRPIAAARVF